MKHLNFTLLTLTVLTAAAETFVSAQFLTLSADCSTFSDNGTVVLTLHTSEPFYGSLYSREFANACKVVGNGLVATKLVIQPGMECGIERVKPTVEHPQMSTSELVSVFTEFYISGNRKKPGYLQLAVKKIVL